MTRKEQRNEHKHKTHRQYDPLESPTLLAGKEEMGRLFPSDGVSQCMYRNAAYIGHGKEGKVKKGDSMNSYEILLGIICVLLLFIDLDLAMIARSLGRGEKK